jgi:arylsulfatase A-like enzyme
MKDLITRRDFLKLAGCLPLSIAAPRLTRSLDKFPRPQRNQPNIIVIVFDALSACNISLFGYQRKTMPSLFRLAEQAIVYHNHYAGGNYTTPGTASLLTGTLPWTHRAIRHNEVPNISFAAKNIFAAFPDYYKITYTHNSWAYSVISYLGSNILDDFVPIEELLLTNDGLLSKLFEKDRDIAQVSLIRAIKKKEEGYAYSLFSSHLYERYRELQVVNLRPQFPRGLPSIHRDNYFLLEDSTKWLSNHLDKLPQPFIGYFHFWPPHNPYNTHLDFYQHFKDDGFLPDNKPFYSSSKYTISDLLDARVKYDEFILYADREFARLYDYLETSGLLENTWVILTSDHGEMFERGIIGHSTPTLYEPLIRIPLLIFEPGRTNRTDIYAQTSAIDVLPTLLHITGQQQGNWIEGMILPPFVQANPDSDRSIYVVEASDNKKYAPLEQATIALIKGDYKLVYYLGYRKFGGFCSEQIELYNIVNDPDELNDLSSSKHEITAELLDELKQKLAEVNEPYL